MPNIITLSYFKNNLFIPLAEEQPSIPSSQSAPNNVDALQTLIDSLEKYILINALGVSVYNQLQIELADLENADQKWKDLVNGCDYDGKIWIGLKEDNSLLANAIFSEFLQSQSDGFFTSLGVAKPNPTESGFVTPKTKIVSTYNEFLNKYQSDYKCIPDVYQTSYGMFVDYFGNSEDIYVSLYKFLKDKEADYGVDMTKFKIYKPINTFWS